MPRTKIRRLYDRYLRKPLKSLDTRLEGRWAIVGLIVLAVLTLALVIAAVIRPRAVIATIQETPSAPVSQPSDVGQTPTEPRAGRTPATSGPPKTLVVLGDEYSINGGWTDALVQKSGWRVITIAERGMGYQAVPADCGVEPCVTFAGAAGRVAKAVPDAILVIGGDADGDRSITPFVPTAVKRLQEESPDARVLLAAPLSLRDPRPYWLEQHARSIERAAQATKATWVDTTQTVGDADAYRDGRLTRLASERLAEQVAEALTKIEF